MLRSSYSLPDEALAEVALPEPLTFEFETAIQAQRQGDLDAAVMGYRQLLVQTPEHVLARFHLGVALADLERWSEAEAELLQVLALQPNDAEAHNSLGLCLASQCRWQDALNHFQQALMADRQYAVAHVNRGLILLKLGRMAEGWADYEWRWQMPSVIPFACPQPRWQGENISDKVLLVHTEQGAGDALQFARFLPMAAAKCQRLLLVCTDELRPLLTNTQGVSETRLFGLVPPDSFDYFCPLLSLPYVLGIAQDNLPASTPYLHVPSHITAPRLTAHKRLKVGICWAGSPNHPNDKHRSCSLASWLPVLSVPNIAFYSLQTPISKSDVELLGNYEVSNLEPELTDFARTAALVEQLDLVIGVDTSVIHLAGALGKSAWVLLGQYSDWRWLLEGEDSIWYPSMNLFRQIQPGNWSELMARVASKLANFAPRVF